MNPTAKYTSANVRAAAKINLSLSVLGRRSDAFHELRSLVIGIDLCDQVGAELAEEGRIEVHCSDPSLRGPHNLAYRAAEILARRIEPGSGIRIDLEKKIPLGAGLGGGSSDAAATLRLCNELWGSDLDDSELAAIGSEIGSDVPLFFSLPGAVISGRGELVQAVEPRWSGWVLLVFAGPLVPTSEVYAAWRPQDCNANAARDQEALLVGVTAEQLMPHLFNDLEPAIFRVAPQVEEVFRALNQCEFGPMRVSGAGSALYRLFDDQESADDAAANIVDQGLGAVAAVVAAPVGAPALIIEEESSGDNRDSSQI